MRLYSALTVIKHCFCVGSTQGVYGLFIFGIRASGGAELRVLGLRLRVKGLGFKD